MGNNFIYHVPISNHNIFAIYNADPLELINFQSNRKQPLIQILHIHHHSQMLQYFFFFLWCQNVDFTHS
jgi:hypothetical protein